MARHLSDTSGRLTGSYCINAGTRVLDVFWKLLSVIGDTLKNSGWQIFLTRNIRYPVNTNSLPIRVSRKLQEVLYDVAVIHIIHKADKRMRKVMCD
jgi:hypothetical protein